MKKVVESLLTSLLFINSCSKLNTSSSESETGFGISISSSAYDTKYFSVSFNTNARV